MYDNTCKYLAETFPSDYASWLLGKPIPLTKLEPSELSNQPIRADSVIFLQNADIVLHIEFQTRVEAEVPFRMVDYWVRLHRKYPLKQIYQVVIYLLETASPVAYQSQFRAENLSHSFHVIRLWEQNPLDFYEYTGLLPLAVLSNPSQAENVLQKVSQAISKVADEGIRSSLVTTTYIISGLVLEKSIIDTLLRSDIMRESVTYQAILLEGEAKGKKEGEVRTILRLLNRKFGNVPEVIVSQISEMTIEELDNLADAILDMQVMDDLLKWLP